MRLRPETTDVLACPKCHGSLASRADGSALECPPCDLAFEIEDGMPNFLVDEAKPLSSSRSQDSAST